MNNEALDYIKTLSNNNSVQETIIRLIGKILLKQDNIKDFIYKNENKILHIRDWIVSISENNEKFKQPRVLTIDALNNAADKYFEKKNNKIKIIELNETHEELIADLGDYYVVQMLTPESLDNESKQMQHCIGIGSYDKNLNKEEYKYLSLRDKYNNAHITLEIIYKKVLQLQGKQNKVPKDKYLEILLPWLLENDYRINWNIFKRFYENGKIIPTSKIKIIENIDYIIDKSIDFCHIVKCLNLKSEIYLLYVKLYNKSKQYILIDKDNNIIYKNLKKEIDYSYVVKKLSKEKYPIFDIKEFYCIFNHNDKQFYSIYKLPDNCLIKGNLDLKNSKIKELPKNLVVDDLYLSSCSEIKELPSDLIIKNNLYLNKCSNLEKISNELIVNGSVNIHSCYKLNELPHTLNIGKNLELLDCYNITKIPDNVIVNKDLTILNSKIKELPENLVVKGFVNLSNVDLVKFPKKFNFVFLKFNQLNDNFFPDNLTVNNLDISSCKNILHLPKKLTVNKILDLKNTNITELPEDIIVSEALFLNNSKIEKLPDNLFLNTLELENCKKIIKLPNKLNVKVLNLKNTNITELPEDIKVDEWLDLTKTKIRKIPINLKCKLIHINKKNISLIKESMDFDIIHVHYFFGLELILTKKAFLKRFKK